jgi:hypothetical protein
MNADELKKLTTEALDQLSTALTQGHREPLTAVLTTRAQFHRDSFHNACLILKPASRRPGAWLEK